MTKAAVMDCPELPEECKQKIEALEAAGVRIHYDRLWQLIKTAASVLSIVALFAAIEPPSNR